MKVHLVHEAEMTLLRSQVQSSDISLSGAVQGHEERRSVPGVKLDVHEAAKIDQILLEPLQSLR